MIQTPQTGVQLRRSCGLNGCDAILFACIVNWELALLNYCGGLHGTKQECRMVVLRAMRARDFIRSREYHMLPGIEQFKARFPA